MKTRPFIAVTSFVAATAVVFITSHAISVNSARGASVGDDQSFAAVIPDQGGFVQDQHIQVQHPATAPVVKPKNFVSDRKLDESKREELSKKLEQRRHELRVEHREQIKKQQAEAKNDQKDN